MLLSLDSISFCVSDVSDPTLFLIPANNSARFAFDFSKTRVGEFSVSVTVSNTADKSVLDPPTDYRPTPTNIGSYNLAVFLGRHHFRWELEDVDAKTNAILVSLGGQPIVGISSENIWRPSSYVMPTDLIFGEAIKDVNDKLRQFVFPKLEIKNC